MQDKFIDKLSNAIALIEVDYSLIDALKCSKSFKESEGIVEDFKALVAAKKRELAKKYHPDRCGGDGDRMKLINAAIDFLLQLRIQPIAKPRPQPVFYTYSWSMCGSSATATGSTYTYTCY